jgi:hypothetical protein
MPKFGKVDFWRPQGFVETTGEPYYSAGVLPCQSAVWAGIAQILPSGCLAGADFSSRITSAARIYADDVCHPGLNHARLQHYCVRTSILLVVVIN